MISGDQAAKILQADLANIIKKVKAGKTLTVAERTQLQASQGEQQTGDGYAKNKAELARALGESRQTLNKWTKRKDFPKADEAGRYNIGHCLEWKRQLNLGNIKGISIPANKTTGELSEFLGCDEKWIRQYGKLGYFEATGRGSWSVESVCKGLFRLLVERDENDEDLDSVKKRKWRAEAELKELQLEAQRGNYMSAEDIAEEFSSFGAMLRSCLLNRMVEQLPGLASGLPASKIRKHTRDIFNQIMADWRAWAEKKGAK